LTIGKLADAFSNASQVASEHVRKNREDIRSKYNKDASLPSFFTIKNTILEAKTEVTANDINLLYWNWKTSINSTLVQVAKDESWSTGQLLKTTKLIANFKLAFKDPNSSFLYEVFEGEFKAHGKDLITYQDFEAIWELSYAIAIHNEEVMRTFSGKEMKTLIGSTILPDSKRLASAIFNSRL
jgi:hypothetical protein